MAKAPLVFFFDSEKTAGGFYFLLPGDSEVVFRFNGDSTETFNASYSFFSCVNISNFCASSGSSFTGNTFSIYSISRLSSDGALSLPIDDPLELPSGKMSLVYLKTAAKPFLKCLV
jgi:hypothetical protein